MPLIYFEVFCAKCGEGLCKLTTVNEKSGLNIEVQPCPKCLQAAENQGFNTGLTKGSEASMAEAIIQL